MFRRIDIVGLIAAFAAVGCIDNARVGVDSNESFHPQYQLPPKVDPSLTSIQRYQLAPLPAVAAPKSEIIATRLQPQRIDFQGIRDELVSSCPSLKATLKQKPILISTPEQFAQIKSGQHYRLTGNINLNARAFDSTQSAALANVFIDGDARVLDNMEVRGSLFGAGKCVVMTNITFDHIHMSGKPSRYSGGLFSELSDSHLEAVELKHFYAWLIVDRNDEMADASLGPIAAKIARSYLSAIDVGGIVDLDGAGTSHLGGIAAQVSESNIDAVDADVQIFLRGMSAVVGGGAFGSLMNSTVRDSDVIATLNVTTGYRAGQGIGAQVGGFVGVQEAGSILRSKAEVRSTFAVRKFAGNNSPLVQGGFVGSSNGIIAESIATGNQSFNDRDVDTNFFGGAYVGGFVGRFSRSGSSQSSITDSYANFRILTMGETIEAGGFVGGTYGEGDGKIKRAVAIAQMVSPDETMTAKGFGGKNVGTQVATNSFYDNSSGKFTDTEPSGAVAMSTSRMQQSGLVAADARVWAIDPATHQIALKWDMMPVPASDANPSKSLIGH